MFRVKICGVRQKSDVESVDAAGGDAIGLNFFPPSVRYLDPEFPVTQELSQHAQERGLVRVGVFVNQPAARIAQIAKTVGLDAVQLHGDETISDFADLRLPKLRAIKLPRGPVSLETIAAKAAPWISAGYHVLFDVDAGAEHGGSGKTLDWPSIAAWAAENPDVPWTLAGGLTPENVAEAMRISTAISVDTAGGAEIKKGVKDAARIAAFVHATTT
jgi:phosphoribosylanthranilate isomerase